MKPLSPALLGGLCATGAAVFFSMNDTVVKFLSGDYALHQIVLIRSTIGLVFVMFLIAPLTGGQKIWRTTRLKMHLFRGLCVVIANMSFFAALAAMPFADTVAIFFVGPLIITVFSIVFLSEKVGFWRWAAVLVGFGGVVLVAQPGGESFQTAAFLPIIAAVAYAGIHIITRKIGGTESAVTMAFYIQIMFIAICAVIGLALGDGRFGNQDNPAFAFLLRAWAWPDPGDYIFFVIIGFGIAGAGYLISQAYRLAEAAVIAPFEYLAMPLAFLSGVIFFDEIPDFPTVIGSALIIAAGLFTVWRENRPTARGRS